MHHLAIDVLLMDTPTRAIHIGPFTWRGLASLHVSSARHCVHHHSNLRVESDIWIPLAPIVFGSITSAQLHWGCGDTFSCKFLGLKSVLLHSFCHGALLGQPLAHFRNCGQRSTHNCTEDGARSTECPTTMCTTVNALSYQYCVPLNAQCISPLRCDSSRSSDPLFWIPSPGPTTGGASQPAHAARV